MTAFIVPALFLFAALYLVFVTHRHTTGSAMRRIIFVALFIYTVAGIVGEFHYRVIS